MSAPAWGDVPAEDWDAQSWREDDGLAPRRPAQSILDAERARYFLWAPVCLGAGIAAYFALPREPQLAVAFVPLVIALIMKLLVGRGTIVDAAMTALVIACSGFVIAKLRVETVRAPVLERALRNVTIDGVVTRVEPRAPRGARITLDVASLGDMPVEKRPSVVRVRILRDGLAIAPGDRVRLKATLAPPAKPALPGGFDYARQAWFERVGGVGYTFATPDVEPAGEATTLSSKFTREIEHLRLAIGTRVKAALPGEQGAIATALITGERGGISAATNAAFKNSGLFHILSISGLHMVIMAGAVFFSLRLLLASVPALALRFAIKKWAATAGIFAALGYLAISGGAFATVRSALMIVVIFGAVLLDRPALALRNVALSAFLILVIYPESLFDAGFQMSFAAVTGLVATYEEVRRRMSRRDQPHPVLQVALFFGGIVFSTLIASAAVAPLAAYHFHQSQQYAVLANLAAIPICNLVVMPAALAALVLMPFGLESLALWPMGQGIDAMTWCATFVAKLPGAVGHIPAIPTLAFALMILGGLWLALWQTRWRLLGVAAVLMGVMIAPLMPRPDILVARNGELVAVRGSDGRLSALPAVRSKFELERWLEYDGDGRAAKEAQTSTGFDCDGVGCAARVKTLTVSVARHPAAINDDCARGDILVLTMPRPKQACAKKGHTIDVFDVWRNGTYALYVTPAAEPGSPPGIRVDTVAAHRGERPWAEALPPPKAKLPKPRVASGAGENLPKFAVRPEWLSDSLPRPEIEDDDGVAEPGSERDAADEPESAAPPSDP